MWSAFARFRAECPWSSHPPRGASCVAAGTGTRARHPGVRPRAPARAAARGGDPGIQSDSRSPDPRPERGAGIPGSSQCPASAPRRATCAQGGVRTQDLPIGSRPFDRWTVVQDFSKRISRDLVPSNVPRCRAPGQGLSSAAQTLRRAGIEPTMSQVVKFKRAHP